MASPELKGGPGSPKGFPSAAGISPTHFFVLSRWPHCGTFQRLNRRYAGPSLWRGQFLVACRRIRRESVGMWIKDTQQRSLTYARLMGSDFRRGNGKSRVRNVDKPWEE